MYGNETQQVMMMLRLSHKKQSRGHCILPCQHGTPWGCTAAMLVLTLPRCCYSCSNDASTSRPCRPQHCTSSRCRHEPPGASVTGCYTASHKVSMDVAGRWWSAWVPQTTLSTYSSTALRRFKYAGQVNGSPNHPSSNCATEENRHW
jgi:hypothetical protein